MPCQSCTLPETPMAHHILVSLHNTKHVPLGCPWADRGRGETPALLWDVTGLNARGDALCRCRGSLRSITALLSLDTTFQTRSWTEHP